MIRIRALRWTPLNVAHISRHAVTIQEVEEVRSNPWIARPTGGGRCLLVGPTNDNRMLTLILEALGDDEYFCVTARSASRQERREWAAHYEDTS